MAHNKAIYKKLYKKLQLYSLYICYVQFEDDDDGDPVKTETYCYIEDTKVPVFQ